MPFEPEDVKVAVRQVDDKEWETLEDIHYRGKEQSFTVPAGFHTDFASVPRPLVWLLPTYGRYTPAAILHDYLWGLSRQGEFVKFDADGIFRRAMRELGVPFVRRWLMWSAVRLASGKDFWKHGVVPVLVFLLVAVPGMLFIALPGLVILLALLLFWVVEWIFFLILKPFSKAKPVEERKEVNQPKLSVRL